MLSNTWWSSRWLNTDLEALGLAAYLDAVLYTSGLPRAKPHPSVFLEAAARVGTEPAACVMVGDDPLCDVAGATGAGMRAIWKRNGRTDETLGDSTPDAIVESLAGVPALLRRRAT